VGRGTTLAWPNQSDGIVRAVGTWVVPNAAYRAGSAVEVVSHSGERIVSTTL
jgi:hypothetical protein